MGLHDEIVEFIKHFEGAEDVFLHGCCYWFAKILDERFILADPKIMHEPVEGHFVTDIGGRLYDVRGDVTDMYKDKPLDNMYDMHKTDFKQYMRLMRDCRDFSEDE